MRRPSTKHTLPFCLMHDDDDDDSAAVEISSDDDDDDHDDHDDDEEDHEPEHRSTSNFLIHIKSAALQLKVAARRRLSTESAQSLPTTSTCATTGTTTTITSAPRRPGYLLNSERRMSDQRDLRRSSVWDSLGKFDSDDDDDDMWLSQRTNTSTTSTSSRLPPSSHPTHRTHQTHNPIDSAHNSGASSMGGGCQGALPTIHTKSARRGAVLVHAGSPLSDSRGDGSLESSFSSDVHTTTPTTNSSKTRLSHHSSRTTLPVTSDANHHHQHNNNNHITIHISNHGQPQQPPDRYRRRENVNKYSLADSISDSTHDASNKYQLDAKADLHREHGGSCKTSLSMDNTRTVGSRKAKTRTTTPTTPKPTAMNDLGYEQQDSPTSTRSNRASRRRGSITKYSLDNVVSTPVHYEPEPNGTKSASRTSKRRGSITKYSLDQTPGVSSIMDLDDCKSTKSTRKPSSHSVDGSGIALTKNIGMLDLGYEDRCPSEKTPTRASRRRGSITKYSLDNTPTLMEYLDRNKPHSSSSSVIPHDAHTVGGERSSVIRPPPLSSSAAFSNGTTGVALTPNTKSRAARRGSITKYSLEPGAVTNKGLDHYGGGGDDDDDHDSHSVVSMPTLSTNQRTGRKLDRRGSVTQYSLDDKTSSRRTASTTIARAIAV